MEPSLLGWDKQTWNEWISNEIDSNMNVYRTKPIRIISDFNIEEKYSKEYQGRELLELIQNADDAGNLYEGNSKMLIELGSDYLCIANTGIPFSPQGVESLMLSDKSPKQLEKTKNIGYKGLGFRSILGWADEIRIKSHNLSIRFSKDIAKKKLVELLTDPNINKIIKPYQERGYNNPISVLAFPEYYEFPINKKYDIYDTIIILKFNNKEIFNDIQRQIETLSFHFGLFLQYIKNISIISPLKNDIWNFERINDHINLIINEKINSFRVYKKVTFIPEELIMDQQFNRIELIIAIPDNLEIINPYLFVYFPTKVILPFKFIVHANFELTDNREHILNTKINSFIANELINFIIDISYIFKDSSDLWTPIKIIYPQKQIDATLNSLNYGQYNSNFISELLRKIKCSAIFPTIEGKYLDGNSICWIPFDLNNYLINSSNICKYDLETIEYLKYLDIKQITNIELISELNKISPNLSIEERVRLILLLINSDLFDNDTPDILIDETSKIIRKDDIAFLPPETNSLSLPPWVKFKIINKELIDKLKFSLNINANRQLINKLATFKINEYNFQSIIYNIIASTNRRIKHKEKKKNLFLKEMVQTIYSLYSNIKDRPSFPDNATIELPTSMNNSLTSRKIYFGPGYEKGILLTKLFVGVKDDIFIATPGDLGLTKNPKDVEDFLSWIGVNSEPRIIKLIPRDSFNYINYLKNIFLYPLKIQDFEINNFADCFNYSFKIKEINIIDHLDDILNYADPHYILIWLSISNNEIIRNRSLNDCILLCCVA